MFDPSKYCISKMSMTVPQWWKYRRAVTEQYRVRRESKNRSPLDFFTYRMSGRKLTVFSIAEKETGRRIRFPYQLQYGGNGLYDYQAPAVAHLCDVLLRRGSGVDGSDTGLGKTFVAINCCLELGLRPAIICHKIGIGIWARVCKQFGVRPYFIINWEYARTGNFPPFRIKKRGRGGRTFKPNLPPDVLTIWDECHVASNWRTWNSILWRSARFFPNLSISATLADRPVKLASLIFVLDCWDPVNFGVWFNRRIKGKNPVRSVQEMKFVRKTLYPNHGIRLSYSDPAVRNHFPSGVYLVDLISLDPGFARVENAAYRATVRKIALAKMQSDVLTAELRYRQLAEMLKVRALAEQAAYWMSAGKSVLIFVNFMDTLKKLSRILQTDCLCFGEQEKFGLSRNLSIRKFQENRSKIIILTAGTGGQSISLHDTRGGHQRISLICPNYSAVSLKQVLGRTLRAGSRSVPVMKLVYAAGTIEEKVAGVVSQKLANISALNDGDLYEPDIFNMLRR